MKKRTLTVATAWLLAAALPCNVCASTLSDLRSKQSNLAQQQKDAKAALAEVQSKQSSLEEEIKALDQNLYVAQQELDVLEAALDEATAKYDDAVVRWEAATAEKEAQWDTFRDRVKFMQENNSFGYLKIILEAKSFTDMLSRMQYVNDIINYDNTTLERLKAAEAEIAETAQVMKEEKEAQEVIVGEQREKTSALENLKSEKQAKMAQYEQDEASYNKQLAELEAGSAEVERLIAAAEAAAARSSGNSGAVAYSGGKLQWPVPGRTYVSSGYVARNKPIGSGTEFHTGLDIPASYGTAIKAAGSGTVITAGWVRGYGYTVMINHGGGLVTLYGHNSSLCVSVGDTVSTGDTIAKCGSTGNSTGNHCHFEVRVNGKHTNPVPYLQG